MWIFVIRIESALEAGIKRSSLMKRDVLLSRIRESSEFSAIAQDRGSRIGLESTEEHELARSQRLVCKGSDYERLSSR